ncbi:MAG: coproporphyrinogen III oxidase [Alphaproteobacteria bacterium]|nr:coproporphyrinogen III oxidase [Alphaproteobacteria bacterium]
MATSGATALYVHWPFCKAKCPYCDFNSHVSTSVDHPRWADQLKRELDHMAALSERRGQVLSSIFFGGGTPSLMAPETMASVINHAAEVFHFAPDIEITMEANPTSVEAEKLAAFRGSGANRLSMGIQSLRREALAFLGREHSADEAMDALALARELFPRVSADFIYARPQQTEAEWQAELEEILALGLDHLSLYQLTLEPGTAFYSQHQRGMLDLPHDDMARGFYDLTQSLTAASGCPAYEVSNHAARGQESQHNLMYWSAGDWLGIGPGAYGRFWRDGKRVETRSRRAPQSWLDDVTRQGHAIDQLTHDEPLDYAHEAMMMGLRLTRGVDLTRVEHYAGPRAHWLNLALLDQLAEDGLITMTDDHLSLTAKGQPVLNAILGGVLIT